MATSLSALVTRIALRRKRPPAEIKECLITLESQWITKLEHFAQLGDKQLQLLNIPLGLKAELLQIVRDIPTKWKTLYVDCSEDGMFLHVVFDGIQYVFGSSELIDDISPKIPGFKRVLDQDMNEVAASTSIKLVLSEGYNFEVNDILYTVAVSCSSTSVSSWLASLGMQRYQTLFACSGFEEFYALPFLDASVLKQMGVEASDIQILANSITLMRSMTPLKFLRSWVSFEGYAQYATLITSINMEELLLLADSLPGQLSALLYSKARFSSIEETIKWTQKHAPEYSLSFARLRVPFYCLPFVSARYLTKNMGGVAAPSDKQLLEKLARLADQPAFKTKAMLYWLNEMNLTHLNTVFAKHHWSSIENLMDGTPAKMPNVLNSEEMVVVQKGLMDLRKFRMETKGSKKTSRPSNKRNNGQKNKSPKKAAVTASASPKTSPKKRHEKKPAPSVSAPLLSTKDLGVSKEEKIKIDAEVDAFRKRLEIGSGGEKAKLSPIFFF